MSTLEQQKSELGRWLQAAMMVELSTIPPYMMALLSIKPGKNRVPANILRGVMMEEMLHLSLAGNLLSAVGERAHFSGDQVPSYPLTFKFDGKGFKDREFAVDLAPFSARNIATFVEIELPEGWREPAERLKAARELPVPGYTIGEFYDKILAQLEELCAAYGEQRVFCGNPAHQLDLNYYWAGGGRPIVIVDLASARKAIELIVTQGEGVRHAVYDDDRSYFDQPEEVAHFFRFKEIEFARHYQTGDDPRQPPSGATFEVDYTEVFPIIVNPTAADYVNDPDLRELNLQFNQLYSLMLYQIGEALNGAPGAMYTAILNSMRNMTAIALKMVATPMADDPEHRHGAPTFEWVDPLDWASGDAE